MCDLGGNDGGKVFQVAGDVTIGSATDIASRFLNAGKRSLMTVNQFGHGKDAIPAAGAGGSENVFDKGGVDHKDVTVLSGSWLDRSERFNRRFKLSSDGIQFAQQLGIHIKVAFVFRQVAFGVAAI